MGEYISDRDILSFDLNEIVGDLVIPPNRLSV